MKSKWHLSYNRDGYCDSIIRVMPDQYPLSELFNFKEEALRAARKYNRQRLRCFKKQYWVISRKLTACYDTPARRKVSHTTNNVDPLPVRVIVVEQPPTKNSGGTAREKFRRSVKCVKTEVDYADTNK